jgi:hypothetical protein
VSVTRWRDGGSCDDQLQVPGHEAGAAGTADELREAAVAAPLSADSASREQGAPFQPGHKDVRPVPVRTPGYKIRFLLPTYE